MTDPIPASRTHARVSLRLACLGLLSYLAVGVGHAAPAAAITFTPFTPEGLGGVVNGQTLAFGADGSVEELDAFLYRAGDPSALSLGGGAASLPTGLDLSFGAGLSSDGTDLDLTWSFRNTGSSSLGGLTFLGFLDAEIAESTTSFFNELGSVAGAPAAGQGFEIDEPGYAFGDIHAHLLSGVLDDTNALGGTPEDVSMALSFGLPELAPGELARVVLQLSEDGDFLGPLALEQRDPLAPTTRLTFSGRLERVGASPAVPEPGAALLYLVGASLVAARVRRREVAR